MIKKPLGLKFDEELISELKHRAAESKSTLTDLIESLLWQGLGKPTGNIDFRIDDNLANYIDSRIDAALKREKAQPSPNATSSVAPLICPHCQGERITKEGRNTAGNQRYRCGSCSRRFVPDAESDQKQPQ